MPDIKPGDFVLCVDETDCRWAIYKVFDYSDKYAGYFEFDPKYRHPLVRRPPRFLNDDGEFDGDSDEVTAVYKSEEEFEHVAEQLSEAETLYLETTQQQRERFAVLARIVVG